MADKKGMKSAVELAMKAGDGASLPGDQAQQLSLIEPVTPPGNQPEAVQEALLRARGRPPGARNRRTEEWVEYLMTRYTSPLEGLLRLATMTLEEIMAEAKCKRLEALQERRHAMIAALPYIHQRQPIAVDVTNHKVVNLTIIDGELGQDLGDDPDIVTVQARVVTIEDNQQLSDKDDGDV